MHIGWILGGWLYITVGFGLWRFIEETNMNEENAVKHWQGVLIGLFWPLVTVVLILMVVGLYGLKKSKSK